MTPSIEFEVKNIRSSSGTAATLGALRGVLDAGSLAGVQGALDKLLERGVKYLVLDCAGIRFISSAGLGLLETYSQTFEEREGRLALCRVPSKVLLALDMTCPRNRFTIVADEAAALRCFAGEAPPPPAVAAPGIPDPAALGGEWVAPPPVAPPYPRQGPCARCRVTLEIPRAGRFRCPRCGAVVQAELSGRLRFFSARKPPPLELRLPCRPESASGAGEVAEACARTAGFAPDAAAAVGAAVKEVCLSVMAVGGGSGPAAVCRMLLAPDERRLTIELADDGKALDFGPGGSLQQDPRFAAAVRAMDTVEHRARPRGGNLLRMVKTLP